jgi:hypothetical protein
MTSPQPQDAWEFWRKSRAALDALNDLMSTLATAISKDDDTAGRLGGGLPSGLAKDVQLNINRLQYSFSRLVLAQKHKGGR